MLCPVVCHCGKQLSAYYDAFKRMREERMEAVLSKHKGKVTPDMISTSDDLQPELKDVLDAMRLDRDCCRMVILTSSDFTEYY